MTLSEEYEPTAVDFSGSQFTVEQTGRDKNFQPEYVARNVSGDTLFSVTYQMYEEKDEFPFVDADENEIFSVKASGTWDIAGDYLLTDSQTGEDIAILDNDISLLQDTWRIRDAEDRSLLAEITSRGGLITLGRKFLPFGQWIAHKYEITDGDGASVGSIEGEFAIFDEYEITLSDASSVPIGPVVIAAIVIDAIQGN